MAEGLNVKELDKQLVKLSGAYHASFRLTKVGNRSEARIARSEAAQTALDIYDLLVAGEPGLDTLQDNPRLSDIKPLTDEQVEIVKRTLNEQGFELEQAYYEIKLFLNWLDASNLSIGSGNYFSTYLAFKHDQQARGE